MRADRGDGASTTSEGRRLLSQSHDLGQSRGYCRYSLECRPVLASQAGASQDWLDSHLYGPLLMAGDRVPRAAGVRGGSSTPIQNLTILDVQRKDV